jgi:hypothetical protein
MVDFSEKHERDAKYMPTPEQIAAMCAEIRAGWSDIEWHRRQGLKVHPDVEITETPVYREGWH